MDSPQSVVSPFKGTFGFEKQNSFVENAGFFSMGGGDLRKEVALRNTENFLGVLEVFVHQARNIHNICIYHKQDVYAKLCLTSDPDNTISTKTVNGGGQNPVFNEALYLNVLTIDSSLKCEVWMLSRARNFLEDQLLGFALVPLSEVLISNGKLEKEFSMSSTDLFHSPAGFLQLSLAYRGTLPEVIAIPDPASSISMDASVEDVRSHESVPCELDKIEFPDPRIAKENCQMVSEYFGIPCNDVESHSCDTDSHINSELGVQYLENLTRSLNSIQVAEPNSPPSSVSTNGSPSASLPVSTQFSDTAKSSIEDYSSRLERHSKESHADLGDAESNASHGLPTNPFSKPLVTVNIEPAPGVVQQDIVDIYMKSMQQFNESLAKMKLPLDIDDGSTISGNSSSNQKSQTPNNAGSRVFYGSRAFF